MPTRNLGQLIDNDTIYINEEKKAAAKIADANIDAAADSSTYPLVGTDAAEGGNLLSFGDASRDIGAAQPLSAYLHRGTTSSLGCARLMVGNSVTQGTAGNAYGEIIIGANNGGSWTISGNRGVSQVALDLPISDGTLTTSETLEVINPIDGVTFNYKFVRVGDIYSLNCYFTIDITLDETVVDTTGKVVATLPKKYLPASTGIFCVPLNNYQEAPWRLVLQQDSEDSSLGAILFIPNQAEPFSVDETYGSFYGTWTCL